MSQRSVPVMCDRKTVPISDDYARGYREGQEAARDQMRELYKPEYQIFMNGEDGVLHVLEITGVNTFKPRVQIFVNPTTARSDGD